MMSANVVVMNDGAAEPQGIVHNCCSAADCGYQKGGALHRKIDTLSNHSFRLRQFERANGRIGVPDRHLFAISEDAWWAVRSYT